MKVVLLEDIEKVGRQGDLIEVKPGYARNFLIPQKKALHADKSALRRQKRLQEDRIKKAEEDKSESMLIINQLADQAFTINRKVDEEGHMYGSVSVMDIVTLLGENNIIIEKKHVVLPQQIKQAGTHVIVLKLKEGVEGSFNLEIAPE
jgi:large subunit ribosomal protein L9